MRLAAGSVLLTGRPMEPPQEDQPSAAGSIRGARCFLSHKLALCCLANLEILETCDCLPGLSIQIQQAPGGDMGHIKGEMEMHLPVKH